MVATQTTHVISGLELPAPPQNLSVWWRAVGRGSPQMEFNHTVNDIINCAYIMKPHVKTLDIKAQGSFLVGEQIGEPGRWCTLTPQGQMVLAQDPSTPCPMYLLIWLFICVTLRIALSQVL